MQKLNRRTLICMAAAAGTTAFACRGTTQTLAPEAPLGFVADPKYLARAQKLLAKHPAIDLHAHPGDTFVRGAKDLMPEVQAISGPNPTEPRAVTDMQVGGM